jgi:hypothetical protein
MKNVPDNSDKLIETEIRGRQVTYYLTTEEDLHNVRSNSLLGDVSFGLGSLTAGGIISVILIRATGIQLVQETIRVLDILWYVFIVGTALFAGFAVYFHCQSIMKIKRIKGSGVVTSLSSVVKERTLGAAKPDKEIMQKGPILEITKAEYGTNKIRLDVTKELRKKIVDNKLETTASNAIKGDPDYGVVKTLTIEYKFNGITITKEFKEGAKVVIP